MNIPELARDPYRFDFGIAKVRGSWHMIYPCVSYPLHTVFLLIIVESEIAKLSVHPICYVCIFLCALCVITNLDFEPLRSQCNVWNGWGSDE